MVPPSIIVFCFGAHGPMDIIFCKKQRFPADTIVELKKTNMQTQRFFPDTIAEIAEQKHVERINSGQWRSNSVRIYEKYERKLTNSRNIRTHVEKNDIPIIRSEISSCVPGGRLFQ